MLDFPAAELASHTKEMTHHPRRLGRLLTLLACAAAAAAAVPVPPRAVARNAALLPRNPPMPDSVLAWVGKERAVTVSRFHRAWRESGPAWHPPGSVARPDSGPISRPDSLTPEVARRFLDLLVDREVLVERAMREHWRWTEEESLQHEGLRDRLVLRAALDTLLREIGRRRQAAGQAPLDSPSLGIAARESVATWLALRLDDMLAARLAAAWAALPRPSSDSSLAAQLRTLGVAPEVDPADTGRVVAWSSLGPYRVRELLEAWSRLSPVQRPRVESASQMRDLVENGLLERWLRERATRHRYDRRPDIAARLNEQREAIALSRLLEREVYAGIEPDSLTLLASYRAHAGEFDLPERVAVIRLVLSDRAAAHRLATRLASGSEAESLANAAARSGVEYRSEVTAESDPALFVAAVRARAGAVVGPDSTAEGFQVARVLEVLGPRRPSFDEARPSVRERYLGREAERRMRALLQRLRKVARVVVNAWAVERLGRP